MARVKDVKLIVVFSPYDLPKNSAMINIKLFGNKFAQKMMNNKENSSFLNKMNFCLLK